MMIGLIAGLLGSTIGRWLAVGTLAAAILTLVVWRLFSAGKASVAALQTQETLIHVLDVVRRDQALRSLSPGARRRWLREYAERRGD
jgi:hypothetical protein